MTDRFCSQCGATLVAKMEGGRERPACPSCGHVVFGHFSVGVGGLLVHDGKVLLVQRGEDPGKGRWTIPGGYVEQDEPPDEALAREVLEETGLRARPVGILAIRHAPVKDSQNAYIVFGMELVGPPGDLKPEGNGKEIARAGFFAPREFAALGDMGLISRWLAEHHRPGDAVLRRLPDDVQHSIRVGSGWIALFGITE